MRIAIDGYNLALPHGTGIARYGRGLLQTLANMGHEVGIVYGMNFQRRNCRLNEISIQEDDFPSRLSKIRRFSQLAHQMAFGGSQSFEVSGQIHDEKSRVLNAKFIYNFQNLYRNSFYLFKKTRRLMSIDIPGLEVMHWTCPLPVRVKNCQNVYTFHDIIPLQYPSMTSDDKEAYYDLCKKIIDSPDKIITVSDSSKIDIEKMFQVPEEREIVNTYQSFRCSSISEHEADDFLRRVFGLSFKQYFFFYGAWEPKKNVGRIIRAYLASGTDKPLIIAGGDGWGDDAERKFYEDLPETNGKNRIIHLGYVPDDALQALVKGARALLFPSIYEGFGLPILEAMSAGTAVLTSSTGSMPEVAGGACFLVDPYEVGAIRDGIALIDKNDELRHKLEIAGPVRAAYFAPHLYEQRLDDLYKLMFPRR